MKVYISGPMRGIEDLNFPAFNEAAKVLRGLGHEVFNPAEHSGKDLRGLLALDLLWICDHSEIVVTLPGWEKSKGAIAEVSTAIALDIPVTPFEIFVKDAS